LSTTATLAWGKREVTWVVTNFEEYIGKRYREDKKAQLEATISNYGCSKAILVVVFDSESKALLLKNE